MKTIKRVLLINPPWYNLQGAGFEEMPLGLAYLASFLNRAGYEAHVYNADFGPSGLSGDYKMLHDNYANYLKTLDDPDAPIWAAVLERMKGFRPDIIGINIKTGSYKSAVNIARMARRDIPDVVLVAGGTHATMLPGEVSEEGSFNFIVKGEGEETFLELLKALEAGRDPAPIKGLAFRGASGLVNTPDRPFIQDLDSLPYPERENLFDKGLYPKDGLGLIITSRGCPYECTFCAADRIWKRKVRYRSVKNVIDEIVFVRDRYGVRFFRIRDDAFTLNRPRTLEICASLSGKGITWQCDTRADILDAELVGRMAAAGCVAANIGLESGSDRILKMIKKGETAEDIKKGVKLLKRCGINVGLFVMIGFPDETEAEIWQTLESAREMRVNHIIAGIVTPYPGTAIFKEVPASGPARGDPYWRSFFHQSPEMGFFADKARFKDIKRRFFEEVERYNRSLVRKGLRVITDFMRDPGETLSKIANRL